MTVPDVHPPHAAERVLRPVTDVSDLPTEVFGSRGIVWWGTIGFMIVESVTLAGGVVSYLYLARNFDTWPPPRTPLPRLGVPTAGLLLLLATLVPIRFFHEAAERLDAAATRRWLWVAVLFTAAVTVLRFLEFPALGIAWDDNAYGSVTWALLVTHLTLLIVDVFETGTLATIFSLGRDEPKHFVDASDNAFYSYFMVLVWVPVYVVVYLLPRWM